MAKVYCKMGKYIVELIIKYIIISLNIYSIIHNKILEVIVILTLDSITESLSLVFYFFAHFLILISITKKLYT